MLPTIRTNKTIIANIDLSFRIKKISSLLDSTGLTKLQDAGERLFVAQDQLAHLGVQSVVG